MHDEDAVLHQVLSEEPELRLMAEANRAAGGGTYEERMRFGELVANAVRAREVRDARIVEEALAPATEAARPGPEGGGWFLSLSVLLAKDGDRTAAGGGRRPGEHPPLDEAAGERPAAALQLRRGLMLLIGWVLGQVLAAAEREYYDPAAIQRELIALETRLEDGEIDEAEFERQEDVLLDRMEEAQQWANGTR